MTENKMILIATTMKAWSWRGVVAFGFLLAFLAFLFSTYAVERPVAKVIDPTARLLRISASPAALSCLEGWTETTGKDPDGQINLKVCTSPDQRYVITAHEGRTPIGYDGDVGRFLSADEVTRLLR